MAAPDMHWVSIDENPCEETIVLKGVLALQPHSLKRWRAPGADLPAFAALLQRFNSFSVALIAHLIVAVLLVLVVVMHQLTHPTDLGVKLADLREATGIEDEPAGGGEEKTHEEEPEPVPEPEPPTVEETAEVPDNIGKSAPVEAAPVAEKPVRNAPWDPLEAVRTRRSGILGKLRGGGQADIVVVEGGYDDVGRVLRALSIPHQSVPFSRVWKCDLTRTKVLVINCDQRYLRPPGAADRLQELRRIETEGKKNISRLKRELRDAKRHGDEKVNREVRSEIRDMEGWLKDLDKGRLQTVQTAINKRYQAVAEEYTEAARSGDRERYTALYKELMDWHKIMTAISRNAFAEASEGLRRMIDALEKRMKDAHKKLVKCLEDRIEREKEALTLLEPELAREQSVSGFYRKVSAFVQTGGYLFTSDWAVTVLEEAVPGYVERGAILGARTVAVRPCAEKAGHRLLEEVFIDDRTSLDWEVDDGSLQIRPLHRRAEVLVESPALFRHNAVAVTFPFGRGRVLHVMSHMHRQDDRHGEYALQNLLFNFMVRRITGR